MLSWLIISAILISSPPPPHSCGFRLVQIGPHTVPIEMTPLYFNPHEFTLTPAEKRRLLSSAIESVSRNRLAHGLPPLVIPAPLSDLPDIIYLPDMGSDGEETCFRFIGSTCAKVDFEDFRGFNRVFYYDYPSGIIHSKPLAEFVIERLPIESVWISRGASHLEISIWESRSSESVSSLKTYQGPRSITKHLVAAAHAQALFFTLGPLPWRQGERTGSWLVPKDKLLEWARKGLLRVGQVGPAWEDPWIPHIEVILFESTWDELAPYFSTPYLP